MFAVVDELLVCNLQQIQHAYFSTQEYSTSRSMHEGWWIIVPTTVSNNAGVLFPPTHYLFVGWDFECPGVCNQNKEVHSSYPISSLKGNVYL